MYRMKDDLSSNSKAIAKEELNVSKIQNNFVIIVSIIILLFKTEYTMNEQNFYIKSTNYLNF